MRPQGSPAELERRRRRALTLLRDGKMPVEVAQMVGVDRRSVRRWKAAYRTEGDRGVKAKPAPGRPPKLSEKTRPRLMRVLLRGAEAAGYPTDLWTCPRVTQVIAERFHVRYDASQVWRLLRSVGWTPQQPQCRPLERDDREIARWIREEWPRIKKKPPA